MASLAGLVKRARGGAGYMVQIWADTSRDIDEFDHFYIKRSDEKYSKHYFYWDALLMWHDTDIIHASSVIVVGDYSASGHEYYDDLIADGGLPEAKYYSGME